MTLEILARALAAHVAAEAERTSEGAHRYAMYLRRGTKNEAVQRRYTICALTRGLIEHDRVITGRYKLDIGIK